MGKKIYIIGAILVWILGIRFADAATDAVACTMEYAPVCATVQVQCIMAPCNPVEQTFSNSCMARAAGATVVSTGECAPLVGGDSDEHGCKASAGYSWDATMKQCVRPWEQKKMTPRQALQSYDWSLVSLNDKNITQSGTLSFTRHTFHAKLCNTLNGKYVALMDRLFTRQVMSTMMYCEGDIMTVESLMSERGLSFMVGSDTLTITTRKWDTIVWQKP